MQQTLGQDTLGRPHQLVQQIPIAQSQQQMAQTQLVQQPQMTQQQIAQTQMAQQQMAQTQMAQQQMAQTQMAQQQMAQQQLAQQQITQPQIIHQQILQPQMLQQQIGQQQLGQPQLQQMMYCPTVRLVYDTPMIMQTGDQVQQQNQNIFTSQPPWARPVQNQVIYLQQIGPNLVPVQHVDPNMFIQQNVPMYQQMVQNVPQLVQNLPQTVQSIPQGQIRQIMNTIPAGMMQNFGTNIHRLQDQNTGQMVQSYGIVQANSDANMSNANLVSNESDRPSVTNQTNTQQTMQNQDLTQVYRQNVSQINQQQIRMQAPATNQQENTQNMQTVGQQTNIVGTNVRPVAVNNNINITSNMAVKINNNIRPNNTQIVQNTVQNTNNLIRASSPKINTTVTNSPTNMPQLRQALQPQNLSMAQSYPQNVSNTSTMQSYSTAVGTMNTVTYSAVRNGQPYTYRAIQPKPNSNVRPNFKPRGSQMPMTRRQIVPVPTTAGVIKMETDSPTFNRKRKSESPDEAQKKISNYGSITVTAQVKDRLKAKCANTHEIGVNTSPVHKIEPNKVDSLLPLLQIDPIEGRIKQEFLSPTLGATNPPTGANNPTKFVVKTESKVESKDKTDSSQQTEEKLVRKTVFPQAKSTGRLLDNNPNLSMPNIDEPKTNVNIVTKESIYPQTIKVTAPEDIKVVINVVPIDNQNTSSTNTSADIPKVDDAPKELSKADVQNITPKETTHVFETKDKNKEIETNETPKEDSSKELEAPINKIELKLDNSPNFKTPNIENILKTEKPAEKPKTEDASETKLSTDFDNIIKDNKIEKKEYKNISVSEMKGKEIHIVDGNIHKQEREKDFVLTHVLDGYVIQESNVPFAIRRPLKEKTVNAYVEDKNDPCVKAAKEEIRGQILELSQLHIIESREKERAELKENEKEVNEVKEDEPMDDAKVEVTVDQNEVQKDNPFVSLVHSIVKTWTVDELASHLSKFNWNDTVSTLQEHEIDGESLFLVNKTQLVTIGINEAHAEVICEFVGSKS